MRNKAVPEKKILNMSRKHIVIVLLIVGILFLGTAKDFLVKTAVTIGITHVVGAPVNIEWLSIGIFKQSVRIRGFKIYNPKGFPRGELLNVSRVDIDYDLPSLLKKKIYLPLVVVNLDKLVVVTNKDGKLNVDALRVSQKDPVPKRSEKRKAKPMSFLIDDLTLSIGKVVRKNYSVGPEPSVNSIAIGVYEKSYRNISSAKQLIALVLIESMKGAAINNAVIYGASALLGVGFLPAGIMKVVVSKDNVQRDFKIGFDRVYKAVFELMQSEYKIIKEQKSFGNIVGKAYGAKVTIRMIKKTDSKTQVIVYARRMFLPRPKIAGSILGQIVGKLK